MIGDETFITQFDQQVEQNRALANLVNNPLQLSLVLSAWQSISDADSVSTVDIYKIALDGILERLQSTKQLQNAARVHSSGSPELFRKLFRQMAYIAHTSPGKGGGFVRDFHDEGGLFNVVEPAIAAVADPSFTVAEWRAFVDGTLKKGQLPLLSWFLTEGKDTYRFAHLTFQEVHRVCLSSNLPCVL